MAALETRPPGLPEQIDFVPESKRAGSPRTLGFAWAGVLLAPGTLVTGMLAAGNGHGPGFVWGMIGLAIGIVAGSIGVAWISTVGPAWGLGTMTVGGFAFGRANVMPIVALLFSLTSYNALFDLFGAKALNDAIGIPTVVAIFGIFALELCVLIVGERLMRIGGVAISAAVAVIVVLGIIGIIRQGITPQITTVEHGSLLGGVLVAIALGLSMSITWGVQACDVSRTLPPRISRRLIFLGVSIGMAVPLLVLSGIGAYISTAATLNDPLGRMGNVIGNGLTAQIAIVVLCLSFALANGLNDYSAGLALQNIGLRLRRVVGSAIIAVSGLGLAFIFRSSSLGNLAEDILIIAGYYTVCWFGIVAIEVYLRRQQTTPWLLPPVAPGSALIAFATGLVLLLPFSDTPVGSSLAANFDALAWLGIVPRHFTEGGGLGYEAGVLISGLLYLVLRRLAAARQARPT